MLRRHFFLFGALGLLVAMLLIGGLKIAGGAVFGGSKATSGSPSAPAKGAAARRGGGQGALAQVSAAVVGLHPFADSIEVVGVAKGRQAVTLTANSTDLVSRVRFHDGEHVPAGAVLVELRSREQDAGVVQAQSALTQAKGNYERWKLLYDKGIAAKASLEQYQATYEQAQAALLQAQSRRQDRLIRAPFAGVVGLSDIAPGALVTPGAAIATLDDVSVIRVDFPVPDRFLPLLKIGAPITARPDAFQGAEIAGRIAQVDTRVDERTRAVMARAEFPNASGVLKPGMQIRVTVQQGVHQAAAAPESAIQFEGDQASVYVITHKGDNDIAEQRIIRPGLRDGGLVEILAGLAPGERVVADGLNKVSPNQPIRVAGTPAAPAAAEGAAPSGSAAR